MNQSRTQNRWFLPLSSAALMLSLAAGPITSAARAQAPDNTRQNKSQSPTADDQKMNAADRALTQKIRKAIHDDTSLSTYAHNIKIISQNGKVTLSGPVRSEDEKTAVAAKATQIAGEGNVTNQLDVAPPKN